MFPAPTRSRRAEVTMGGVSETTSRRGEASPEPLGGRVLKGRYRLVRKLATGHLGAVYLAREIGTEARVAVKVLHAQDDRGGARVPAADARARRAVQAAALPRAGVRV